MNETVIIALLVFIITREVMFHISLQKLVNKVMAGSYQGYLASERTIGKTTRDALKLPDDGPQEDLAILT